MTMAYRKIVLVTGGNSGVGYETAKAFLTSAKPYHVLLAARTLTKATWARDSILEEKPSAVNDVEVVAIDLSSDESIGAVCERIQRSPGRIDALINNAGSTFDFDYLAGKVSLRASFTRAYDTNVAGTHVLTHILAPLLLASSDPRLLFVAGLSNITQAAESYFPTPPQPPGWPKPAMDFETIAYRCSKTALNMLMLDWNWKLKQDGVKVWGVGPGFLATNLGGQRDKVREMGDGHPRLSAEVLVRVAEGAMDDLTGRIVGRNGVIPF